MIDQEYYWQLSETEQIIRLIKMVKNKGVRAVTSDHIIQCTYPAHRFGRTYGGRCTHQAMRAIRTTTEGLCKYHYVWVINKGQDFISNIEQTLEDK